MHALLLLLACAEPTPQPSVDLSETDTRHDTSTDPTDGTDPTEPAGDATAFQDMLAGAVPPEEAVPSIAWSGGFPIESEAGTFLFLCWSERPCDLAGDFNGWTETRMTQEDGYSWLEVEIEAPEGQRYKLVQDGSYAADPWARSYEYDTYGEISFVRPPTDRARLDRWPDLVAEGLLARDLRVLVPPGSGPFRTLYAHDGQNLFDPDAMWGGWQLQDAASAVAPMIIVGIDNTADRMDEYTHVQDTIDGWTVGGSADDYARLVTLHVRPHIEGHYAVGGPAGLLGSSLGGLVSLSIAQQDPGAWDFVASMSGTLGWGAFSAGGPTMQELYLQTSAVGVLYVDSGGDDGGDGCDDANGDGAFVDDPNGSDNYCDNRAFVDAMSGSGLYVWDDTLFHWWEPGAEHNEAAWALRVATPLEVFAAL